MTQLSTFCKFSLTVSSNKNTKFAVDAILNKLSKSFVISQCGQDVEGMKHYIVDAVGWFHAQYAEVCINK